MKKKVIYIIFGSLTVLIILLIVRRYYIDTILGQNNPISSVATVAKIPTVKTAISSSQNKVESKTTVTESTTPNYDSPNAFWLESGAFFYTSQNTYHTIIGDLPANDHWRLLYASTNPRDTDDGYHPQNIFRLLTKNKLTDISEEVYMLIVKDNLSPSSNRNESNGLLLISRYVDSNNLYYAGIRVDGTAVIKKKVNGIYYTLAQTPLFVGDAYNRDTNPNLLPKKTWIGLRVTVVNTDNAETTVSLFVDRYNDGTWKKILSYQDSFQGEVGPLTSAGNGGIRTDFMDVEFRDFSFMPLISP